MAHDICYYGTCSVKTDVPMSRWVRRTACKPVGKELRDRKYRAMCKATLEAKRKDWQ